MRILIRADASSQIGAGHVMRCLSLAIELRQRGAEVVFLCRAHQGHLGGHLADLGWPVRLMPLGTPTPGTLAHATWLGASHEEEAAHVREAIGHEAPFDWLLVDHYALDASDERRLRTYARKVAVIDDIADRAHDCDLLVDTNPQLAPGRYDRLVPAGCPVLLGPRFALLRPEFATLRHGEPRPSPGHAPPRRLLVSLGAADPDDVTGLVLDALADLPSPALEVDVVIGRSNPRGEALAARCASMKHVRLHVQTDRMAELMRRADLMIGAPGTASWERCCLGLPSIVIGIAANQRTIGQAAGRQRFAWYLGQASEVNARRVRDAVVRLLARPRLLELMSRRASSLVDGRGAARVAAALTKRLRIDVVSDAGSWINAYLPPLVEGLRSDGHTVRWIHDPRELGEGDCAFFLSCSQLVPPALLARHAHNLVVHESDLPQGRGWSPMTWQVLEGKDRIPVTLFEAERTVDSGVIYAQDQMVLRGDELVDELRAEQARVTLALCRAFVAEYPANLPQARPQRGTATYYPRRGPAQSRLDPKKTLAEQFNLLRVVDNERYPAFFEHGGVTYVLRIEKSGGTES